MQFGTVSTAEIARSANQPWHRAWNLLFLLCKRYRPTSRTPNEAEELDDELRGPLMPPLFRYFYSHETANAASATLKRVVEKLGESAGELYTANDLAEASGLAQVVVRDRLNIGRREPDSESALPATLMSDGTPLFDGLVLALLSGIECEVASC